VVFGDILDAEGKKVETAIRAEGGEAAYVHLDVTRRVDCRTPVKLREPGAIGPARHPGQQRRDRHPAGAIEDGRPPSGTA